MSMFVDVRKSMSLDQIVVFANVYAHVIILDKPFASAVAKLQADDPKRDSGAVKKVIDSLNVKFKASFHQPLLERSSDDQWSATELGDVIYEFAADITDRLNALTEQLSPFARRSDEISFSVRNTMVGTAAKLSASFKAEENQVIISRSLYNDDTLEAALMNEKADVCFDELFFSDKSKIDSRLFRYIQVEKRDIVFYTTDKFANSCEHVVSRDGTFQIDIEQTRHLSLALLRQAYPIRAALEIMGARPVGTSLLDQSNVEAIQKAYQRLSLHGPGVEDLAMSLPANHNHALLVTSEQIRQVDDMLGMKHVPIHIMQNGLARYYNLAIIYKRSVFDQAVKGGGQSQLLRALMALSENAGRPRTIRTSYEDADYSKSAFDCAHCGHRVEYDDSDESDVFYAPCANCLSVNEFDVVNDEVRQVANSKNITYTDDIYGDLFVCPTVGCDAEFVPHIRKTVKGRDFLYCDQCHSIFQSRAGKAVEVSLDCPAIGCGKSHKFHVSDVKPIEEVSCYNSMQKITYNRDTGELSVSDDEFIPIEYETENDITSPMAFPCPNHGCSDTRSRAVIRNIEGQTFARCRTCKADIHIKKVRKDQMR